MGPTPDPSSPEPVRRKTNTKGGSSSTAKPSASTKPSTPTKTSTPTSKTRSKKSASRVFTETELGTKPSREGASCRTCIRKGLPRPTQANKRGNGKVARRDPDVISVSSENEVYPTPNATLEVRPEDVPKRSTRNGGRVGGNGGKQRQGPPSTPKMSAVRKGKQPQVHDSESESGSQKSTPSEAKSSRGLTPDASSPEPVRRKTANTKGESSSTAKPSTSTKPSTPTKTSTPTSKTKSKKSASGVVTETEFGTKKQGLQWIVYSGRTHLDNMAEFEEICTMRNLSEQAKTKAETKRIKAGQGTKRLELKIAEVNLRRMELMSEENCMVM